MMNEMTNVHVPVVLRGAFKYKFSTIIQAKIVADDVFYFNTY